MARRYCYNDVLPLTAMVATELTNVGLNILFKRATSKGMSNFVFITYTYALGALFLFPFPFIFPSRAVLPSSKFHIGSRIFLIGLIGYSAQLCSYKGIEYSSPTLASVISNLSPAFTFILALLFRLERVVLSSSRSQAKIIGTIASISGALVVVLYKGPKVLLRSPIESSDPNWVLGGIFLTVAYVLYSVRYIVQTKVLEIYPAELNVTLVYNLCGAIISAPVSLIVGSDQLSSWLPRPSVIVITFLYSGADQAFASLVIMWAIHLKGPVYIALFKPLSIVVAAFMSAIFLGDSLHLGSIIGGIIVSMGFYAVLWGKAKEGETTLSSGKVPLLKVEDNAE